MRAGGRCRSVMRGSPSAAVAGGGPVVVEGDVCPVGGESWSVVVIVLFSISLNRWPESMPVPVDCWCPPVAVGRDMAGRCRSRCPDGRRAVYGGCGGRW
jgi:hypothetical protein